MRNDTRWRLGYQSQRYMRHLTQDELDLRHRELMVNHTELMPNVKLGLFVLDQGGVVWMQMVTELLEEYRLRYGQFPNGFRDGLMKDINIPRPDNPIAARAVAAVAAHPAPADGTFIAKYGEAKYLQPMLSRGAIRLQGARYYDDKSFDLARKAEELRLSVKLPGDKVRVQVLDRVTKQPKGAFPPPTSITYTTESETDYYVYCTALAWKPRLFLDFKADACLLITKPEVFLNRLAAGVAKRLEGTWWLEHGPVIYFDPLRTHPKNLMIGRMKDFKYAYQREYRVMWFPPEHKEKLSYIDLEIGDLTDCSQLILL